MVKQLRSRSKCLGHFGDVMQQAANEIEALAEDKARAVYIAEHLFGMVPREAWRDAGGDDGQGHYEGYYWAESTQTELEGLR